jgi:hypothetical protein
MSFTDRLSSANPDVICGAKADAVRTIDIETLLRQNLRIPIFQRRYCWGKPNWRTFLSDTAAASRSRPHSLGRITCAVLNRDGDGDGDGDGDEGSSSGAAEKVLLVIDGQQRNTTAVLLLAALRDIASSKCRLASASAKDVACCRALISQVHAAIFPNAAAFQAWLSIQRQLAGEGPNSGVLTIQEGTALRFCALVPTWCDRASFFCSVLPPIPTEGGRDLSFAVAGGVASHRPLEAKKYFTGALRSCAPEQLASLADAVLHKLSWLYFPISVKGESLDVDDADDGTTDIQVVFERLAQRDATWCRPHRSSEFANMGAADFVRNLLLGSFRRERYAVEMYKSHWLPIEQLATAAAASASRGVGEVLEGMLERFLAAQECGNAESAGAEGGARGAGGGVDPTAELGTAQSTLAPHLLAGQYVGGQLYSRFRAWVAAEMGRHDRQAEDAAQGAKVESGAVAMLPPPPRQQQQQQPKLPSSPLSATEERTAELLQRLKAFATDHFSAQKSPSAAFASASATVAAAPGKKPDVDDTAMVVEAASNVGVADPRWVTSESFLRGAGQVGMAESWACPRCSFQNPPNSAMCSACCFTR